MANSTKLNNRVEIAGELCKGCRLCIASCPTHSLALGTALNKSGYRSAVFEDNGCTACGICFYMCPEPEAVTVLKGD
jgi:ferredoxin